ncbi:MAG: efflux RND transporter periplasmic adaptor subunit [Planctomycetaceae bacterium]|nr:efflux RND transporter periplasmic adaptor subunit [Planctomycetaceae bacterium]
MRPQRPKSKRGWLSKAFLLLVAVVAIGGVLVAAGVVTLPSAVTKAFSGRGSSNVARYLIDTATRAPFRMAVRSGGAVNSLKSVTLTSKVEGTTTIISIVPEGTMVKEGDLLVELDASTLVESEKQQVIAVTQADAALKKAEEGLAIQKGQNESDKAAAELALLLANLDLEKWIKGDYPQQVSKQEGLVKVAEEELERAKEVYEYSKRLGQKGFVSSNQLEADRIAMTKAEINVEAERDLLRVLKDYSNKRSVEEFTSLAAEAERAIERVERQGIAAIAQFQADLDAARLTLDVEKEKLERARTQIANSKIYAPQAGEVIYAVEDGGRGDQEDVIKEGASIRERKPIINLPDLSQMKVDVRIHESLVSRVRTGLPARIRIDAVPGKVFRGKVLSVSSVPVNGDWMRPDLKEYACAVSIDYTPGEDAQLKPGLTAEVEIIVQERPDVLQVQFQSIVTAGQTRYAYVLENGKAVRREVVTGAANDTHVEILDGIAEGEKVILNPRTHFSDELAALGALDEPTSEKEGGENAGGATPAVGTPEAGGPSGAAAGPGGQQTEGGPAAGAADGAGRPDPAQFFARLDKNGDGGVTKDEVEGRFAENFDTMDANKDGKIDQAEFAAGARNFGGGRPGGGQGGRPGGEGGGRGGEGGGRRGPGAGSR